MHDHRSDHLEHAHHFRGRNLALAIGLNFLIFLVQIIGSLITGSLSLLADSAHNLTDFLALGLSFWAVRMMARRNDADRTYGYGRVEVLVALVNGASLLAVTGLIFYEAVKRLAHPEPILGAGMFWVTLFGLIANALSVLLLRGEAGEDLNRRSAFLHLLSDTLSSVGVLVAAVVIWRWGWRWVDPVASILIAVFFVEKSWGLVREAVHILLESVPGGLDLETVAEAIRAIPGVEGVHDLHIWSLSSQVAALSAHLLLGERSCEETQAIVDQVRRTLVQRFGLTHVTLQPEAQGCGEGALWCSLHDEH